MLIGSALWDLTSPIPAVASAFSTPTRYRFERGVDPAFNAPGCELATELVMQLCGGEPSERSSSAKAFRRDRRSSSRGADAASHRPRTLDAGNGRRARKAGLHAGADARQFRPPSCAFLVRPDVEARPIWSKSRSCIAGLDRVQSAPLTRDNHGVAEPVLTLLQRRVSGARRALAAP